MGVTLFVLLVTSVEMQEHATSVCTLGCSRRLVQTASSDPIHIPLSLPKLSDKAPVRFSFIRSQRITESFEIKANTEVR
jgi:hypothetical protein